MPGGKITIKSDSPDLESFLVRKRYSLDKWLLARNITSLESFKALLSSGKWVISESLARAIEELLRPVSEPVKAFTSIVTVPPVVIEEPIQVVEVSAEEPKQEVETQVVEVSVEEPKQEVETQVILNGEDSVVSPVEEIVPQAVEDSSIVPVSSYKERKKSR